MPTSIAIIGSGVIGLSTGIALLDSPHPPSRVTIVSSNFPTDTEGHPADYASPWAGAHHVSAPANERERAWDRKTLDVLRRLMDDEKWAGGGGASPALLHARQSELFANPPASDAERLAQEALNCYENMSEVSAGHGCFTSHPDLPADRSFHFDTIDVNVPVYLPALHKRFIELGGKVVRARAGSIAEVKERHVPDATAVFVAPGLGVRELRELRDEEQNKTFAVRGQTVLVNAPWLELPATATSQSHRRRSIWPGLSRTNEGGQRDIYIIPRGGGQYIVGGTRLPGDEDPHARPATTHAILTRALKVCPALAHPARRPPPPLTPSYQDVEVLAVNVGFRPARDGGSVLERRDMHGVNVPVVLGYGFGGYGYQNSWGVALEARQILLKTLGQPLLPDGYTLRSLEEVSKSSLPSSGGVERLWHGNGDPRAKL